MISIRPYQREAANAVYDAWRSGEAKDPLVEIGTAGGKSVVIATMISEMVRQYYGTRVLMATHVKELIGQNYERLKQVWPDAPVGLFSAGFKKRDGKQLITFGGVQTMAGAADEIGSIDVMMIDEAHLIPHSGEGQYRRLIGDLRKINPQMKLVGFTASPFRLTSGMLTDPHNDSPPVFDKIVYSMPYIRLLEGGYVAPLITKGTKVNIDLDSLNHRGGEFIASQVADRFDIDHLNRSVVNEIMAAGEHRRAWMVFASSIKHGFHLTEILRERGIDAHMVTGNTKLTPKELRESLVQRFVAGEIRCLINVDVLTTGFDAPICDLIAIVRATESPGLLLQIVGRGVRLFGGKDNCMVLDFGRNFARLGPIDELRVVKDQTGAGGEKRPAPMKQCPNCTLLVHASAAHCPECDHQFPRDELKRITPEASDAPILSLGLKPKWHDVTGVRYLVSESTQSNEPMVVVEYQLGLTKVVREYVLLESRNEYTRSKAVDWWRRMSTTGIVPADCKMAQLYFGDLRKPGRVMLQKNGKYQNVIAHDYTVEVVDEPIL